MAELVLTHRSKRDLEALPRPIQEAVVETLTILEVEPRRIGKELRGRLRGLWSCQVGNYRILYTIEGSRRRQRVVVRAIRHRGAAYGARRGRSSRRR